MKDVPTGHSLVGGLVSRITDKGFGIGLSKMGEEPTGLHRPFTAMRPATSYRYFRSKVDGLLR